MRRRRQALEEQLRQAMEELGGDASSRLGGGTSAGPVQRKLVILPIRGVPGLLRGASSRRSQLFRGSSSSRDVLRGSSSSGDVITKLALQSSRQEMQRLKDELYAARSREQHTHPNPRHGRRARTPRPSMLTRVLICVSARVPVHAERRSDGRR